MIKVKTQVRPERLTLVQHTRFGWVVICRVNMQVIGTWPTLKAAHDAATEHATTDILLRIVNVIGGRA
ncbi:hypothetical protein LWF01_02750 [Saxibacter everestensis]|uniref:BON domain-containing protein n=1 Tax=Saxibacter everestensis TaxID=2909229 RepID=A0ABY8QUJ5_9MICO|nr:hypothetical protein LWF01_02750 [Brevibacteriaceae bacterium ZFBP1038]